MIRACKHEEGPQHDCGTVDAINKLIPRAERAAIQQCTDERKPLTGGWFARYFIAEMQFLAETEGLRKHVKKTAERRS